MLRFEKNNRQKRFSIKEKAVFMGRIRDYTVVDLEMTGLSAKHHKIIEIGAVRIRHGHREETYETLVNPGFSIESRLTELTGITNEMLADGAGEDASVQGLLDFIGEDVLVGQNIYFDYSFIKQWAVNKRIPLELKACDTLKIARKLLPKEQPKSLEALCGYFRVDRKHAHRALEDAIETWQVYEKLADLAEETGNSGLLEPKPLQCRMKRQTPATAHQIERLKAYMERHGIQETIDWDRLTRSEASRKMDLFWQQYGK